jgi:hypothetical protein
MSSVFIAREVLKRSLGISGHKDLVLAQETLSRNKADLIYKVLRKSPKVYKVYKNISPNLTITNQKDCS